MDDEYLLENYRNCSLYYSESERKIVSMVDRLIFQTEYLFYFISVSTPHFDESLILIKQLASL